MSLSAYVPSVPLNSASGNPLQHLLLVAELEPNARAFGGLVTESSGASYYGSWMIC